MEAQRRKLTTDSADDTDNQIVNQANRFIRDIGVIRGLTVEFSVSATSRFKIL